jgi:hypothetical protein
LISLSSFVAKRGMRLSSKKERKERKNIKKKKMRIKIAHVLTKLFHVPIKRDICQGA